MFKIEKLSKRLIELQRITILNYNDDGDTRDKKSALEV
jgi:hypothetical protein